MGRCETNCMMAGDADGDGVMAVECGGLDCDDSDRLRHPGAVEVCDPDNRDEDCNPTTFGTRDRDGDGFVDQQCCNTDAVGMRICGTDCNDFRRSQSPGALEVCNGLDEDCDGVADNGVTMPFFPDRDFDLYGARGAMQVQACPGLRGYSLVDLDCDDNDPSVSGPQPEFCDGRDNNCNGMVDENTEPVRWYPDDDGDGFGVEQGAVSSCTIPEPRARWVLRAGDCDDTDSTINPAAAEICDGRDNNCNGRADFRIGAGDYEDDDGDGAADVRCAGFGTDCEDHNPEIYGSFVNARGVRTNAAMELCDGLDNDCNGTIDDRMDTASWYVDRDGDGFGDRMGPAIVSCQIQAGRVQNNRDCDDANPNRNPLVIDPCNGIDDDCDGFVDEDASKEVYFRDADRDGFGGARESVAACRRPNADAMGAWSLRGDDCNDMDPLVYPGARERCNMIDDNCDGTADDGALATFYEDADRDGHGSMAPGRRTVRACVAPAGFAAIADDCDDGDARRFPGNLDVCDGIDNDCNAVVDQAATADLACGRPHASATCVMGRCSALVCDAMYADCNGLNMDGCEANTRTIANCNGCGLSCARANATAECNTGVCRVEQCAPGFSNCDAMDGNGCETATNNVNNCGRCGVLCPAGASCLQMGGGYTCGCPGVAGLLCSGRCVDTASDRNNCGACGNVCAVGASCSNVGGVGTCVCPMAAPTLCGGRCTDTNTDRGHCGGCGQVCEGTCVAGSCVRAIGIATGRYHACLMLNDASRSIRCWGYQGDIGDGTNLSRLVQTPVSATWRDVMPARVPIELNSAGSGEVSTVRVSAAGMPDEVWYWGGITAPLGAGNLELVPVRSGVLGGPVDAISHGGIHVCFVRAGSVYCFGNNSYDQCAQIGQNTVDNPTLVAGVTSVRSVYSTFLASSAVRNNGTGYIWGANPGATPQLIAIPGRTIEAMVINDRASRVVAITTDGLVAMSEAVNINELSFCSGMCTGMQPVVVALPPGELASTQIALSETALCVVLREVVPGAGAEVRCRGSNTNGELGDGTLVDSRNTWRTVLTRPATPLRGVVRIGAGGGYFCATNVTGAVYCWGDNQWGQLGDGTNNDHSYATPILWP
jgi:hypothetical protein